MSKIYAVRKGITPGIYYNWEDCENNIKGFSGAEFKKFACVEDAEDYLRGNSNLAEESKGEYRKINITFEDVDATLNEIEMAVDEIRYNVEVCFDRDAALELIKELAEKLAKSK